MLRLHPAPNDRPDSDQWIECQRGFFVMPPVSSLGDVLRLQTYTCTEVPVSRRVQGD